MGSFGDLVDKWKLWQKARASERANAEYERALSTWRAEDDELVSELSAASHPDHLTSTGVGVPIVLHKSEHALLVLNGATLVEPKRVPGQWVGGYSGFSFRVMKGVTYHTGSSRGRYVAGPEAPTPIANGTVTITNQRVVFQSASQAREFAFAKLLGYQHDPAAPLSFFQVSNRQKVSGIGYDFASARIVRFRLALGIAEFQGEVASLVDAITGEIREHEATQPRAPVKPALSLGAGESSHPTGAG